MRRTLRRQWAAPALALVAAACLVSAQADMSLNDILGKNLEAAGGKAKLAQIKTLSFRTGASRNVVSSAGELKVLGGKDPVVTEAVLVAGGRVRRNAFNSVSEIGEPQKTIYLTLAKLYSGLFTLAGFEGRLKLVGLKTYGPEKLYDLTTVSEAGPVSVHFYLLAGDLTLKRLVFQGKSPEGDKYEVNYDFAPFEDVEGLRLPLTWFVSQVGTRGNLNEVTDVKTNIPLDKGFFSSLEVNIGRPEAAPGEMRGNVLDFNASPFGLTIVTNWTKKEVDKAGFKTGDKLDMLIDGVPSDAVFYASTNEFPPQSELAKGASLLSPMLRGGEAYAVQIIGRDTAPLTGKLKALAPISVKKRAN